MQRKVGDVLRHNVKNINIYFLMGSNYDHELIFYHFRTLDIILVLLFLKPI